MSIIELTNRIVAGAVVIGTDTHTDAETNVTYSDNANIVNMLVNLHRDCPNVDSVSFTFGCYSHDDYMGVRFTG